MNSHQPLVLGHLFGYFEYVRVWQETWLVSYVYSGVLGDIWLASLKFHREKEMSDWFVPISAVNRHLRMFKTISLQGTHLNVVRMQPADFWHWTVLVVNSFSIGLLCCAYSSNHVWKKCVMRHHWWTSIEMEANQNWGFIYLSFILNMAIWNLPTGESRISDCKCPLKIDIC